MLNNYTFQRLNNRGADQTVDAQAGLPLLMASNKLWLWHSSFTIAILKIFGPDVRFGYLWHM